MKPLHPADFVTAEPLGLRGVGRRLPSTRAALHIRNSLLVEAALLFHRGASNYAAASAISKRLALYRSCGWRRHRVEDELPLALVGKIEELFWHVLKERDGLPSERTIRAVLDAEKKRRPARDAHYSLPMVTAKVDGNK